MFAVFMLGKLDKNIPKTTLNFAKKFKFSEINIS